jgi:hypothetical protein
VEDRKNRLKSVKNTQNTQNLLENEGKSQNSTPIFDPRVATELFGEGSVAFINDMCELVRRHGIEGVVVVTLHQGVVRTTSTGAHPVAREHARQIAVQLADRLSHMSEGETRAVR